MLCLVTLRHGDPIKSLDLRQFKPFRHYMLLSKILTQIGTDFFKFSYKKSWILALSIQHKNIEHVLWHMLCRNWCIDVKYFSWWRNGRILEILTILHDAIFTLEMHFHEKNSSSTSLYEFTILNEHQWFIAKTYNRSQK